MRVARGEFECRERSSFRQPAWPLYCCNAQNNQERGIAGTHKELRKPQLGKQSSFRNSGARNVGFHVVIIMGWSWL